MKQFLAHNAFARTNRLAIAMILVCVSVCLSVYLSVCLSGTGIHCDHMVHVSMNLSLSVDSPMFWAL